MVFHFSNNYCSTLANAYYYIMCGHAHISPQQEKNFKHENVLFSAKSLDKYKKMIMVIVRASSQFTRFVVDDTRVLGVILNINFLKQR